MMQAVAGFISKQFKQSIRIVHSLLFVLVSFGALPQLASAGEFYVFGPEAFERYYGDYTTETRTFSVTNTSATYTLRIYNGGLSDNEVDGDYVPETKITLNGMDILGGSSGHKMHHSSSYLTVEIELDVMLQQNNVLTAQVRGMHGGKIIVEIVGVDTAAPTITASVDPVTNAAGWNTTDTTVSFVCDDADGDIQNCTAPITVTTEGAGQIVSGTAEDTAGNTTSTSVTLNIDKTLPTIDANISPIANAAGWQNADVTVSFTCADALSTIAGCTQPIVVTTDASGQIISGTAADIAGNSIDTSATINLDKTSPTVVATVAPPANINGWHNAATAVSYVCNDNLSGVVSCPTMTPVTGEGDNQVVTASVSDVADNTTVTTTTFNIDTTPPVITASVTPAANPAGWHSSDVTISFICTDILSGVDSCPAPVIISTEGAGQVFTQSVTDMAGNTSSTSVTLNIDKSLPTINASVTPAPNAAGWYASDVTVSFTCGDAGSGVSNCPSPQTVTLEGANQTITGIVTDLTGNSASTTVSLNIDKTLPSITASVAPVANANGWNNNDVTVTFTCNDTGSGITSCPASVTVSNEGAGQSVNGTAIDLAGNTATTNVTLNIDKTVPSIDTTTVPAVSAGGWVNTDVTVNYSCTDALSGIANCPSSQTVSTSQTVNAQASDMADNQATTSLLLNIDKTVPTITASLSQAPNASGWHTNDVTVTFTCSDTESGIATCPAPITVATEGAAQVITGTAIDGAGNTASANVTLNIDKSIPTISSTVTPSANASGWSNSDVTVSFDCQDTGAGVASCTAPVVVSTEGANQIVTGTVTDTAGNTTSTTVTVNLDKTVPSISASVSPAANAAGWYSSDVTVTFSCGDTGSGAVNCPAPQTLSLDGANQVVTGNVNDAASNTASTSVTLNIDKSAPTITASVTPTANAAGWYNADVTVSFTCADIGGAVANCPSPQTVTLDGANQVVMGTVTDEAGNTASTSVTLNVDKIVPTITATVTPTANVAGWNNTDVTVSFTCTDIGSAVSNCPSPQTVTLDGANQVVTGIVTDVAGNTASTSVTLNIDKTAPTITASVTPTANAAGWNNTDVTITFTCADAGGAVPNCPSPIMVSTEGAAQAFTGTITDSAGNSTSATVILNIDKTPPVITSGVNQLPNVAGWNNTDITSTFMCLDDLSGVASCTSPVVTNTEGANQTVTGTAVDVAGNTSVSTVVLSIDKTAPAIVITSPSNNAIFSEPAITVTGQVTDLSAGTIVTVNGVTVTLDQDGSFSHSLTLVEGVNVITVSAIDAAGNASETSLQVTLTTNAVPQITSIPVTSITEGAAYIYDVDATDSDIGDSLSYALVVAPTGMVVDAVSGIISWTPAGADVGVHDVQVTVTDNKGASSSQTYTLTVDAIPNRAPVILSQPNLVTVEGKEYRYDLQVEDPDGDAITIQLDTAPNGVTVDQTTDSIVWPNPVIGSYPIALSVLDPDGLSSQQQYQLLVVDAVPPVTTLGKDFAMMFNRRVPDPGVAISHLLYISSLQSGTAQITGTGLGIDLIVNVVANEITTVDLSSYFTGNQTEEYGVQSNAIYVQSDVDITLYLNNMEPKSTDATLVLPVDALGLEYIDLGYKPKALSVKNYGDFIGVVATEDNTVIEITLSRLGYDGMQADTNGRFIGVPFQITMNRGESYQIVDLSGYSTNLLGGRQEGIGLSGTVLSASKPIAVFGGNSCAFVRAAACDHIVEQLPPTDSWGATYYTLPLATRIGGDTFRILASHDNTYVTLNGDVVAYLNKGEFYETLVDGSAAIEGSHPILVAQYANGAMFDYVERGQSMWGDPLMVLVPPSEQFLSSHLVTTPSAGFDVNYVNIIAHDFALNTVKIDGVVVDPTLWQPTNSNDYLGAQVPVAIGSHTVTADTPVGVYMYGFGYFDSYGYLGDMALAGDEVVSSMEVTVTNNLPIVNDSICVDVRLYDANNNVIPQKQVGFARSIQTQIYDYARLTDITGHAQLCYQGHMEGNDQIVVTAQQITKMVSIDWQAYSGGSNIAPQIVSLPIMRALPLEAIQDQVIGYDVNGDQLSYRLVEFPDQMTIEPTTGMISWITPRDFDYAWVTVEVSDGVLSTTQRYRITIPDNANRYPTFTEQPPTEISAGHRYIYSAVADDPDSYLMLDMLQYRMVEAPAGLVLGLFTADPFRYGLTNRIYWDVTDADIGVHNVSVQVTDAHGLTDTQSFTINVVPNAAPVFSSTPITEISAGKKYTYQLTANDAEGDTVSYQLVSGPVGMTYLPWPSYKIEWNPVNSDAGDHAVSVIAQDVYGGVTTHNFILTVIPSQPPVFTSTPSNIGITGHTYTYDLTATDAEGDPISYELTEVPSGMTLFANQVTWIPALDQVGDHTVLITASDPSGSGSTQSFTLSVALNQAPQVTSIPGVNGITNHRYLYFYEVSDPDGDPIGFSQVQLIDAPVGMQLVATGKFIRWTPTADQVGLFPVSLQISDGFGAVTTQSFVIDVAANQAPVFTSQPEFGGKVGSLYTYYFTAQDPDGDGASFSMVSGPAGMQFYPTFIRWTPTIDDLGIHPIVLEVRDGGYGGVSQQSFNLTIIDNVLTITNAPANPVILTDELYSFDVDALHPDNLPITFALDQAPADMSIDPTSGVIQWTPAVAQIGIHAVAVRVFDSLGQSDTANFTLQVDQNPNQPPVISSQSITTAYMDELYTYQISASDPQAHVISYTLEQAPAGMIIGANSGLVQWVPTALPETQFDVTVRATDELGMFSEQSYVLNTVINNPPTLNTRVFTQAAVGHLYTMTVVVTDIDGDAINFSVQQAPAGFTIGQSDGVINWTPTIGQVGVHPITVLASDGHVAATLSWNITVSETPAPITISASTTPQFIQLNETTTLSVFVSGGVSETQVSVMVDGLPVTLNAQGQAVLVGDQIGRHSIVIDATDGTQTETSTLYFVVSDPADITAPVVQIDSPAYLSEVTAPTAIVGTVQDESVIDVLLAYKRADQPDTEYVELYRGTDLFLNQAIADFDPTQLVNGIYQFVLQATDSNNLTTAVGLSVVVTGDLKVGNFSFTVEDLNIPLAGIPITVSRTYDSRRRSENLDFGYGWSVDYQNIRIEESDEPSKGWYQVISSNETFKDGGFFFSSNAACYYPKYDKNVTVTLPNGDTESFIAATRPQNGSPASVSNPDCYLAADRYLNIYFVPTSGTQSTLESPDGLSLYLSDLNDGYLSLAGDGAAKPITQYKLTTRTGYVYNLNQNFGITSVVDPNGNTLTYTADGITHSSGKSVQFIRDGLGRISEVIDPKGNSILYGRDAKGDLTSVTDAGTNVTQYTYNTTHGLLDIIDPLGRTVTRNLYDVDGRLIAQEDNVGNRIDFTHDIAGRQSMVTDRRQNVTIYYYDAAGNVTSQVDAMNGLTEFTYDANDNQLSKRDPVGNLTEATYNAEDDQLTQTDGLNNTVNFTYNSRGQELTIVDAKGNLFVNDYDAVGNLLSITDPDLNTAGNTINLQGQVELTRDLAGNETAFTYDGFGNKATETNPLLQVTTYAYDENGNVLTESQTRTVDGGAVATETTQYFYNALDHVERMVNKSGETTLKTYDSQGQLSQETNARGFVTDYVYDAYGRLVQTTYQDQTTETKGYDANGNLISEIDRLQREIIYEYDALDRQTRITYFNGTFTQTEYDAAGRVTAEIDERGNRTEYEYNAANQRTITRDALLNETVFDYDANGNLISQVDANNQTTTFEYDALDRRTKTIYPDTTFTLEGYDVLGRVISKTDQAGLITNYEYNALGQLTAVVDALNQRTEYTYDEAGNKLTQKDAKLNSTSWTYDAMGRVLSRTLPEGQSESFGYDANGNQTSHTDFNGQTTTFIYDENDRLTEKSYLGNVETYIYDSMGNRTSSHDTASGGTTTYGYDVRNRLTLETQPDGTQLTYGYDAAGNRTSVTTRLPTVPTPTVEITTYGYDILNRLETVTDNNSYITTYGYDNVGNRQSVSYPNGNTTVYVYDTLNRLTQVQTKDSANTVISQFDYTLGLTGRRDQVTDLMGTVTTYGYDDLYRLLREDITGHPVLGTVANDYQYDEVGNRTYATEQGVATAYSYDNNDRLLTAGGETYVYDDNGNTLTTSIDATVTTNSYNANNRLIQMIKTEAGIAVDNVSYTYDLDGLRTAKNDDGVTTNYVVDKNRDYAQVLNEVDTSFMPAVSYVYGDDLIKQSRAANDSYYLYDGLGSTRALTDDTGQVTDTYDYSAYGAEIDSTGSTENSYRFTGEQFDANLDNYYLRARYYDPLNGRFTQQDTWMGINSYPVTLHKYVYANADPVSYIDPTGNFSLGSLMGGINGAARLVATAIPNYISTAAVASRVAVNSTLGMVRNFTMHANRVANAGRRIGNVGSAVSKAVKAFRAFTRSKKFKNSGNSKHYMDISGPSLITKTKQLATPYVRVWKLYSRFIVGGKPGRLFELKYKIGQNGQPAKGTGFTFRVDYQDYVSNPPKFKPHYHLCAGSGTSCKDHHYF